MPDDQAPAAQLARVVARPTPAPPPPMPAAVPSAPAPVKGWEIDPDQLGAFTHAVQSVRDRLRDVQAKVDRMRAESYTPKLGTSPVGVQLEEKFADRLDAPVDDPANPMAGGLRPMLAVAMHRMDAFVAGAEAAVQAYQEHDSSSIVRVPPPNS
jgi:hypothetical protein